MEFFKSKEGVEKYIKMAEGFDGRELIEIFKKYLQSGKSVLELGMGPGKDLDILQEDFIVTGSDYSQVFLDLYRAKNPHADLIELDAKDIVTARSWDGIYSNKVLHHLKKDEMKDSIKKQAELLNEEGLVMHTYWKGNGEEHIQGIYFAYYELEELKNIYEESYEVLAIEVYTEMEEDDSIYIIARRK